MESEPTIHTLEIKNDAERLDKVVSTLIPDLSRTAVQRLIDAGYITVNGVIRRAAAHVYAGDKIIVEIPQPVSTELIPESIPLDIMFEDKDILVVNKSAGMVVHPGAGNPSGTLVNAVLAHCPDLKGVGGILRPGIVHRLDKQTSGIIIIAKHDIALQQLQMQFKNRTVQKKYIALLIGQLEQSKGMIDAPIGRHKIHRKRMAVTANGKEAKTKWEVVDIYSDTDRRLYTLVNVGLFTGRTHQIRVHFSWVGYPILGDSVYGPTRSPIPMPRQFLHAASLTINHPVSGESMDFAAPLPDDLDNILKQLSKM
jgi:23S rRNA pseudouridine1911/1915/1917 synthase